jgi:hypothetical protein
MALWQKSSLFSKATFMPQIPHAVGMKHGVGYAGGSGHKAENYRIKDGDLSFLRGIIGNDIDFYYPKNTHPIWKH